MTFFAKRLVICLLVFTLPSLLLGPLLLSGYTPRNFTLSPFFQGVLLIIFGGCPGTSLLERRATMRYGVNPAVSRDARQNISERHSQQSRSALVFLIAGAIILAVAFVLSSSPGFLVY